MKDNIAEVAAKMAAIPPEVEVAVMEYVDKYCKDEEQADIFLTVLSGYAYHFSMSFLTSLGDAGVIGFKKGHEEMMQRISDELVNIAARRMEE